MRIQLTWTDPITGELHQPILSTPVALGRVFEAMPAEHQGQQVSRLVLNDAAIGEYHTLIQERNGTPLITTPLGLNIQINSLSLPTSTLFEGDAIQIGSYSLQLSLSPEEPPTSTPSSPSAVAASPSTLDELVSSLDTASIRRSSEDGGSESPPTAQPPSTTEALPTEALPTDGCDRMVGFLFKRRCDRTSREGCPHCHGGRVYDDPYFYEYDYYPGYSNYGRGSWGHSYYSHRDYYYYDHNRGQVDFTQADAAAFDTEADQDYEMDMGAS